MSALAARFPEQIISGAEDVTRALDTISNFKQGTDTAEANVDKVRKLHGILGDTFADVLAQKFLHGATNETLQTAMSLHLNNPFTLNDVLELLLKGTRLVRCSGLALGPPVPPPPKSQEELTRDLLVAEERMLASHEKIASMVAAGLEKLAQRNTMNYASGALVPLGRDYGIQGTNVMASSVAMAAPVNQKEVQCIRCGMKGHKSYQCQYTPCLNPV
ncbi:hypothetical protein BDZ91DRAFT_809578 [Kalaharituber pfeilii]|nr:hypothetical protein BDZ91DRAFT_809578 [Kalaharituber pfeilii]